MKTSKELKVTAQDTILRMKTVARRMVGMYRLMDEQSSIEENNVLGAYVTNALSYERWRRFKTIVETHLYKDLTSPESMIKTIQKANQETGSLKDLLWAGEFTFPFQSVSIKIGNIMEHATNEFVISQYADMNDELKEPIKRFFGYKAQTDIAVKKGDTTMIAELKYNFNVDTEKSKAIAEKLDLFSLCLKDLYNGEGNGTTTNVSFVSFRYPTANDIPKLKPALEAIRAQYIIGYQQFFNFFGTQVTEIMWKNLHKSIGKKVKRSFAENRYYAE